MKFRAPTTSRYDRKKYRDEALGIWHSRFAWRPVGIDPQVFDGIAVPRHYVWLERYECRKRYGDWLTRTYSDAPPLKEILNQAAWRDIEEAKYAVAVDTNKYATGVITAGAVSVSSIQATK
jgi:hypothetical protein